MHSGIKRVGRKLLKVIAWVVASLILLLIVVALLIQLPAIQTRIVQQAISFVKKRTGTEVSLGAVSIGFPKIIVLEEIYLEDQNGDTLLYSERLGIDTDLLALTRNEIHLNRISLQNTTGLIHRAGNDSAFNFTFIIDAFLTDDVETPDTTQQEGWTISIGTVDLEGIRLRLNDHLLGNFASLDLGHLLIQMEAFDLEKKNFAVGNILLENTVAHVRQTKLPAPDTAEVTEESTPPTISLKQFLVQNLTLTYEQSATERTAGIELGKLRIEPDQIDLQHQVIGLAEVELRESRISYATAKAVTPEEQPFPQAPEHTPWNLRLNKLILDNNRITYKNHTQPLLPGSLDFNHLDIARLTAEANDIAYNGVQANVALRHLSFDDHSGFSVRALRGTVGVNDHKASLRDFLLETGNSRLELSADAQYASLDDLADNAGATRIRATLKNTHISLRDLLYLDPTLLDSLPVTLTPDTGLHIEAAVDGSIDNLAIRHLTVSTLADTHLEMQGKVVGLTIAEEPVLDIAVSPFRTTRADLQSVLAPTLLPDSVHLPEGLTLKVRYRGTPLQAFSELALTSDFGDIGAKGKFDLDSASATRGINLALTVNDFDIGALLGKTDSVMDKLNLRAALTMKGLALAEMDGTLEAIINHLDYGGYAYQDLVVQGNIRDQVASLTARMKDRNLDFDFDAKYIFNGEVPRYTVLFDLANADFRALNLSSNPVRARGNLQVDLATADFHVLNGTAGIRNVAVFNGDDFYAVDSLLFASIDQEGRSEVNIDSDLFTARFEGTLNVFALPSTLRDYIHSYYSLHDSLDTRQSPPQRFQFEIDIRNTDLLTELLVPELSAFDPGPISGTFDSEAGNLEIDMEIHELQYANVNVKSFAFHTESDPDKIAFGLTVDRILVDSTNIEGIAWDGTLANDTINTSFAILDSVDHEKYVLAGTLLREEEGFAIRVAPGGTVLNYETWRLPDNNIIRIAKGMFAAENFELRNGQERIILHSEGEAGKPVSIGFRGMNLAHLTSAMASGILQGDIRLLREPQGLTFTSDLSVRDLAMQDVPWGTIVLKVSQQQAARFDVDFALTGDRNDVRLTGFYLSDETPTLDVTTRINRFDLRSLQPLLSQVRDLSGSVQGSMSAKGAPSRPDIGGDVNLSEVAFFSNFLNTGFTIDDESITFVDDGIAFDRFEIADQSGHIARLDGRIGTRNYLDPEFHLNLTADNFRLLNTSEGDNDLFYGRVDIRANARIRGTSATPIVDVDVGLAEGSNLTYIVPQSEASVLQAEGIVKFVDKTFEGDPFMQRMEHQLTDTVKATFRGIDLTARIELTDQERFTIVMDPLTKDQLSISGNSTLILQIDPTGNINLAGRFEIAEGTYNLTFYKFVKREFAIEQGSSITWLGDPLNAQMDIRAIYEIETSPIELFLNQLTGASPNETNAYKQRLPFQVYLNLTGELLQPEIAFRLDMPEEDRNAFGGNVYARLRDINTRESDLNKQVFALLILRRFISDDPFENRGGGGLESTARRSVSKILSEQLNRLSENIKGVELSFDIKSYEDYQTGQAEGQTELQLGVSKSLFNDRLVVKLSGNVDIEGQNANRSATDYIGDLALEYKITPDGRFRITGFRNSNYDMIDGELIETGTGLIYIKDYNALRELFRANAETRK